MTEPLEADDIIPPVTAGRVRGIAHVWLKPNASKAFADLEALAKWLDNYHEWMRDVLAESDESNGSHPRA